MIKWIRGIRFRGRVLLLGACLAMVLWSGRFVYSNGELSVYGLSSYILAQGGAGLLYIWMIYGRETSRRMAWVGLLLVLGTGFALRAGSFGVEPVKESDYYRFLWDGAVTAHGLNPYRHTPRDVLDALERANSVGVNERTFSPVPVFGESFPEDGTAVSKKRLRVAERGENVLRRINAPAVRTIYPPVSQACFALAHRMFPFEVTGLRVLYLLFDVLGLVALMFFFRSLDASFLLTSVYWLNPLVIRQVYQGLHMEVLLFPLLLLGLFLVSRRYVTGALCCLVLAAGIKIWPVVLLPLFICYFRDDKRSLLFAAPVVLLLAGVLFWPMGVDPLSPEAGWVAYGRHWRTNAGVFSLLLQGSKGIETIFDVHPVAPAVLARAVTAAILIGVVLWFVKNPPGNVRDLLVRCFWTVFWMFMLLPAQFPWYALWMLPFMVLYPALPALLIVLLVPVYDSQIYFLMVNRRELFEFGLVWLQWVPVLIGVLYHYIRKRTVTDELFLLRESVSDRKL